MYRNTWHSTRQAAFISPVNSNARQCERRLFANERIINPYQYFIYYITITETVGAEKCLAKAYQCQSYDKVSGDKIKLVGYRWSSFITLQTPCVICICSVLLMGSICVANASPTPMALPPVSVTPWTSVRSTPTKWRISTFWQRTGRHFAVRFT